MIHKCETLMTQKWKSKNSNNNHEKLETYKRHFRRKEVSGGKTP